MQDATMDGAVKEVKKNLVRTDTHSYKLVVTEELFAQFQDLALRENTSVVNMIALAMKLLLRLDKLTVEPGSELILKRPGKPDVQIEIVM